MSVDSTVIGSRLTQLRDHMAKAALDALLIPRADEYLGEYLPACNERMLWASGFTGSAGLVIVLPDRAAIFVDGRYTQQVQEQAPADLFDYLHLIEEPPIDWLCAALASGARVGADPRTHTASWWSRADKKLASNGHTLIALAENIVDLCWADRPAADIHAASLHSEQFSGRSSQDKRLDIGARIAKAGADAALVFAADSMAWLLNIRGSDVPHTPLVLGFGVINCDSTVTFFCHPEKIPEGFDAHVGEGVRVRPENEAIDAFRQLDGKRVLFDPNTSNAWMRLCLENAGATLVEADDPVLIPKACKNATEIAGMRAAHIRDAVAEIKFLCWLDAEVAAGRLHNEAVLSDKLLSYRANDPLFRDTSFDTISAAGANAAMAHYRHSDIDPAPLLIDTIYLFDSGGQYLDGTTDITRTVAIGQPSDQHKRMFTLVLKGHIALDQARFPVGTTGNQLDALARQYLWAEGFDYDHGTGHGVGSYLSVHEGPQRIGKTMPTELMPGMVVSNEPGYYRAGAFGIRCENLVLVTTLPRAPDADREMLGFEALTLVPFDTRLLDRSLLTAKEIDWLNTYHQLVRTKIGPLVEGDAYTWLMQATEPLSD